MIYLHSCDLNTQFDFTVPSLRFFFFLKRLLRKLKRKLSFLFVGKGKLYIMKLFFEEFNLFSSRWPVLKCNQGDNVFENFEVLFFYPMVKKNRFLKENLCIYKCFIDV